MIIHTGNNVFRVVVLSSRCGVGVILAKMGTEMYNTLYVYVEYSDHVKISFAKKFVRWYVVVTEWVKILIIDCENSQVERKTSNPSSR